MKQKVALVLASGGARGIAHMGVIDELEKHGFEITSVAGTSMGALVGGIYCAGSLEVYKDWMCDLDRRKVFSLVDFTLSREGVVKGERVLEEIQTMVPNVMIEDMHIPFSAVATDIVTGDEVVFTQGKLFEAIRASVSMPSLFVPYRYNNRLLVDGGIINPLPLNRVKRQTGDIMVAVDLSALSDIRAKSATQDPNERGLMARVVQQLLDRGNSKNEKENFDTIGYTTIVRRSTDVYARSISQLSKELYKPDIIIDVPRLYDTLEFYKSEEIIEQGATLAREVLGNYLEAQAKLKP